MTHDLVTESVQVADLHTYHRNPRQGAKKRIAQSLTKHGQYKPITVNRGTHTGRPSEVIAGNHTLMAARDLNWGHIKVCWVDVDEDEAARIVADDNHTSDLATNDDRMLAELLGSLPDTDLTTFDRDEVDDLLAGLQELPPPELPPEPTDSGEPAPSEPEQSNVTNGRGLADLANDYAASEQRYVMLTYEGDRYVWVINTLAKLAETYGTDSNSDTIIALLEESAGDSAPAAG